MKKILVFCVAVMIVILSAMPVLAYDRTADAVVYADFEGEDTELSVGSIPTSGTVTYLNGMAEDTKAYLSGGALKIELGRSGFVVLGQDNVKIRDESGTLNYKYLVMRIKGETGNENRTAGGGLLLFVGGGDGSHAITLNDRPTGTAPSALDANGKPMNAISTEWQEFAIALTETNVRVNPGKAVTGFNINSVSTTATLYIDDIYFSNTAPATAAVYDPATSTDAITGANNSESNSGQGNSSTTGGNSSAGGTVSEGTGSSNGSEGAGNSTVTDGSEADKESTGDTIANTGVKRLDPPKRDKEASVSAKSNTLSVVALVITIVTVVLLAAVLALIYIKLILKI